MFESKRVVGHDEMAAGQLLRQEARSRMVLEILEGRQVVSEEKMEAEGIELLENREDDESKLFLGSGGSSSSDATTKKYCWLPN